jgi:hypothetical protein
MVVSSAFEGSKGEVDRHSFQCSVAAAGRRYTILISHAGFR